MLDGMGELPAGWEVVRLDDLVKVLDTQRQPIRQQDRDRRCAGKQASQLFPYYGATGQVGWIDGFRSEGPGILLGEDGAPFLDRNRPKAYPVDGRYWVNNHAHLLKPRDPRYFGLIRHQLNYVDYERLVSGTTRLKLTLDALRRIPILTPPADEAERIGVEIGKLFTELDEAEAALARARVSLAEYRASLLHAACTGQLTAAWRASRPHPAEDGPALLRRVLAERRAAWERAELGRLHARGKPVPVGEAWKARYPEPATPDMDNLPELPAEWAWASLDQLSWASNYGTSAKCGTDETGMPILRIPNVQSGSLEWSNLKYTEETFDLRASDLLAVGDLLVVRTNGSPGLLGRAAVIDRSTNRPSYFASYLIRFRLLGNPMLHQWIAAMFGSGLVRQQVDRYAATSAGQYNISQTNLARFALPLPPANEAAQLMNELANNISTDEDWPSGETIATLRQSILHAAFTGRLVPQNPADEPAAALLARLRDAPALPRRTSKQAHVA